MGLMLAEQLDVKHSDDPMDLQNFLSGNSSSSSIPLYKYFAKLIANESLNTPSQSKTPLLQTREELESSVTRS